MIMLIIMICIVETAVHPTYNTTLIMIVMHVNISINT